MPASTLDPPHISDTVQPGAVPAQSNRWIDLLIVLLIAFGPSIASSAYLFFRPRPIIYTNARAAAGIVWELLALTVFGVLFKRQNRTYVSLGLSFRWTDLPKALGLYLGGTAATWVVYYGVAIFSFALFHRMPTIVDTKAIFANASLWILVPFLLLNPVFEEVLVRGYLMTEVIQLRSSVALAVIASLIVQTSYHLYYGWFGALMVGSGLAVYAVYYGRSRRLWPVILAHMLWDLTALLGAWHR